ncbi:hypothetical protein P378_00820 [Desulforamulus profundi]|uniref:Uncharacterized protein n=1 Tax=Desulforamulus profundi TaxID=1383067 RepID=A0A2C6LMQ7_9FIRM|nr:hypothetical protein [Desulforamulus profundi]PHJ39890.1 hypothetical protein P378_00820 [Desulforamulus profundi]
MLLTERYKDKIDGVLACYDRVVIHGNIPVLCFGGGMTSYLYQNNIKIFDYPDWANALREELREHAERMAKENGLEIEFIRYCKYHKSLTWLLLQPVSRFRKLTPE